MKLPPGCLGCNEGPIAAVLAEAGVDRARRGPVEPTDPEVEWAKLKTILATEIPNTHKTKRFYEAWNDIDYAFDYQRRRRLDASPPESDEAIARAAYNRLPPALYNERDWLDVMLPMIRDVRAQERRRPDAQEKPFCEVCGEEDSDERICGKVEVCRMCYDIARDPHPAVAEVVKADELREMRAVIVAARAVVNGRIPAVSAEMQGSDWKHSRISDGLTDGLKATLDALDRRSAAATKGGT